MKRLKLSCAVFSALLILMPMVCLGLNKTNNVVDGFTEDFESYSGAETIIGTNGWYGDTNEVIAATITTNTPPLSESDTDVLNLDASASILTNLFDQTGGITNVYIDMMVQMSPTDKMPTIASNDQIHIALWLNSTSNLVVRHEGFHDVSYTHFTTNSTFDQTTITNGQWIRLTLTLDYLTFFNEGTVFGPGYTISFFKVMMDGIELTNANAFTEPLKDVDPAIGSSGGSDPKWFPAMNTLSSHPATYFSSLGLAGSGMLDNLYIGIGDPFYVPGTMYTVTVINVAGGMITPNDAKPVESNTASIIYDFDISNGWFLQSYKQGGTVIPATGPTFQIANVLSNLDLSAVWVANSTGPSSLTNGVPEGWLQTTLGIYTNDYSTAATNDSDLDGYHDADEFLMGTNPLDSNDFLRISSVTLDGSGYPVIKWRSNNIDTNYYLPPFEIQQATNMTGGPAWSSIGVFTNRVEGPHTNVVTLPAHTEEIQYYYKVVATNN